MKSSIVSQNDPKKKWDGLVIGFFEGDELSGSPLVKYEKKAKPFLAELLKTKKFSGKEKELLSFYLPGARKSKALILVGLGAREKYSLEKLRQITGSVLNESARQRCEAVAIDLKTLVPADFSLRESSKAFFEACGLLTYRFEKYKKPGKKPSLKEISLLSGTDFERKELQAGMRVGKILSEAANIARNFAGEPAEFLTPRVFADRAKELAKDANLHVKVLDEKQIKQHKMGGLIGVARGSHEPPRFIILESRLGSKAESPIVLVGKGVTFDSGGISLKPAMKMDQMKYDMSGAAAVIATLWLVGKMKLPINVVGIVPTCENMPSEKPQRPGDIVTISNGKTVEVLNTDAEGRLILADGLVYANRYKPRYIVDLATLTGACRAALGEYAIGIMGNNQTLIDSLKDAGDKSGERCWEFPLYEEYREHIRGEFADIQNMGRGVAGASIGGIFLQEFVDNTPWVHLDIASTAWFDSAHAYIGKGPSGAGVRLLAQFLGELAQA